MGFDNHKQEVFKLVQSLKTLFLYTQGKKETVKEYARNLRSLWDTVEAFEGSPGVHKGLVEGLIRTPEQVADPNNVTEDELAAVEAKVSEAVKGALLISSTNKRRYGKLKDKLANSYLLGSDQYPNTFDKATRILGNYQTMSRPAPPYKPCSNNTGVVFLQQGGRGNRGGWDAQGKSGEKVEGNGTDTGGNNDVSMVMARTGTGDGAVRTNSKGESHCFHCGAIDHWVFECPQLSEEQQTQLHMNIRSQEEREQEQTKEGYQLLNMMLA
jgi:hypothetical protein